MTAREMTVKTPLKAKISNAFPGVGVLLSTATDPQTPSETNSNVTIANQQRAEIGQALESVRRRNRVAAIALGASAFVVFAGAALLYWYQSKNSDPVELRLRSPFELVHKNNPKDGSGAPNGATGDSGSFTK